MPAISHHSLSLSLSLTYRAPKRIFLPHTLFIYISHKDLFSSKVRSKRIEEVEREKERRRRQWLLQWSNMEFLLLVSLCSWLLLLRTRAMITAIWPLNLDRPRIRAASLIHQWCLEFSLSLFLLLLLSGTGSDQLFSSSSF